MKTMPEARESFLADPPLLGSREGGQSHLSGLREVSGAMLIEFGQLFPGTRIEPPPGPERLFP
jgi:hypothetical protein